ncbi:Uncharacterized protein BP5553_08651 [Venustampulla echinocandica]|uniref:Small ribosomal subunit protein mS38 n=1 Tax=Venustampulla echinocandica TaxID=2656787 RepID=A0A370TEU5_9HELO|nr:Uncharacterized protein BP5553_08651 [Venustampulla echinocandica]RDL33212.1 Uncharacterized protein BP5553_08651 [Venustampulla echinocandica]
MFSSSVWRVASTAPSIPTALSSAPRAAASQILSYRNHQRRYSSSKPPSPADGSNGVADGRAVPAAPAQARPDGGKKGSRSSRKKTRDGAVGAKGKEEALHNLPSVPSTQHIAPNQLAASDFFSLHRPISITNNFPKAVTEDAFAAIFTQRAKPNPKPSEVISTLSRTLDSLDTVSGNMKNLKLGAQQEQWNEETDELRAAITAESYRKAEVQHLDAAPEDSAMNFPRHILSGRYQPFNPPPPPAPMNTPESLAAGAESAAEPHESQHRTYTTVLTIEESTDENGDVTYQAHSSPLVAGDQPTSTRFLERMQARQERHRIQRAVEFDGMFAISVKRQRKLKMKKHKYKKLMRRTRNLRRRLDRN